MESSSVAIPQAMQRLVGSRSEEQKVTPQPSSTTTARSAVPSTGKRQRKQAPIPVDLGRIDRDVDEDRNVGLESWWTGRSTRPTAVSPEFERNKCRSMGLPTTQSEFSLRSHPMAQRNLR
jgi:hypothetical protein